MRHKLKKKKKIVLLGSYPEIIFRDKLKPYKYRSNLVTSWNVNLFNELSKSSKYEIHFISIAPIWKTVTIPVNNGYIHFIGHLPKIHLIDRFTRLAYSKYLISKIIKKIKPSLVHGIGLEHAYAWVAQTLEYPVVITIHGVVSEILKLNHFPYLHIYHLLVKLEKSIISRAKYLISINPYITSLFSNQTSAKIFEIPNPISPVFFNQKTTEEYDIAFVGMITANKRLGFLLKALQLLKEKKLNPTVKIIGGINDVSYWRQIRSIFQKTGVLKHIEFLGQKSQIETARIMSRSKCLVLTSLQETAPMVISEAMALGKPVIATDVGGVRYMVADQKTGFLIPNNRVDLLAEKLILIMNRPDLRHKMGRLARKFAFEKYEPKKVAKSTLEVYDYILKNQK